MPDKQQKVLLIGRADLDGIMMDGQTVKTRTIYQQLEHHFGKGSIILVETKDYKKRALPIFASCLVGLVKCNHIIVVLSRNGRRFFFPLLAFAERHLGKHVFHCLIGGALADDVRKNHGEIRYLNAFDVNWVEFPSLARDLKSLGVSNVQYLPNFKNLRQVAPEDLLPTKSPWRFCTFSRVSKSKGIADAIAAVETLRSEGLNCSLDVYGPIDPNFDKEFGQLIKSYSGTNYMGCIDAEKSVEAIRGYSAMLFPTKWSGEGMPGTVIDSLAAGLPVLAYRWRYYPEILEDGVTGYSCTPEVDELISIMRKFMNISADAQMNMKRQCLLRSYQYDASAAVGRIANEIETISTGRSL